MYFIYNLLMVLATGVVRISALFSRKMKLFVTGREQVMLALRASLRPSDRVIWFHAASLGEYEQGLPLMEEIRRRFPAHKIVLTFFSPSGYEVRKHNKVADVTVYLPMDTSRNARRFLDAVRPEMAFFIKYEFWPNFLRGLRLRQVPTYLVSGIFRENQIFFSWYGGFYRKALTSFSHFFVQNETSAALLEKLGYRNVTVSGDTRFDRVAAILERDNSLSFVSDFKAGLPLLVAGSTWPKDEALLAGYINQTKHSVKLLVAPHNIKPEGIAALTTMFIGKVMLYSEMEQGDLPEADVFILDTVGILTKVYSYADVAYVGGGFGHPGVHNVLEPAVFGAPVVTGPNYHHFAEAVELVARGGMIPIADGMTLGGVLDRLFSDEGYRTRTGDSGAGFVQEKRHATRIIMEKIEADVTQGH